MNFSGVSNRSIVGKLMRLPLRLIPHNMVLPIMQGPLRGYRWVAGSSNHGCWLGSYEFEKQQQIITLVKPGTVAFDVGAHVGYYALLFAHLVGEKGQVVAFEPLPQNIHQLEKHVRINKLANVEIRQNAVGEHAGVVAFEPNQASTFAGRVVESGGAATLEVPQVNLDALISAGELPEPQFIKIDVEGAELGVLKGARQTLQAHHPTIFLATHGPQVHRECCDLLRELGYDLTPIGADSLDATDEIIAVPGA